MSASPRRPVGRHRDGPPTRPCPERMFAPLLLAVGTGCDRPWSPPRTARPPTTRRDGPRRNLAGGRGRVICGRVASRRDGLVRGGRGRHHGRRPDTDGDHAATARRAGAWAGRRGRAHLDLDGQDHARGCRCHGRADRVGVARWLGPRTRNVAAAHAPRIDPANARHPSANPLTVGAPRGSAPRQRLAAAQACGPAAGRVVAAVVSWPAAQAPSSARERIPSFA